MLGTALYNFAFEHGTSASGWRAIAARLRDDAGDAALAELSPERRLMRDRADDADRRAARVDSSESDDGLDLDECANCGGSTAVGTPDPHVCPSA